jgi:predicted RNase H-like HicB family nuclease
MPKKLTGIITKEEGWYVGHCLELGVVSQGKSIDEAKNNLQEAVDLYVESFGEGDLPESLGEIVLYPLEVTARA